MRTVPAAVTTFLATRPLSYARADLFTFVTANGALFRWTSSMVNLTVSGNTFLGDGAVASRSRWRQSCRGEIDTLEIMMNSRYVLPDGRTIGLAAIQGYFRSARVYLDHLIMPTPGDISLGPIVGLFVGNVSEIQPDTAATRLTIATDHELLDRTMLPRYKESASCAYQVYDAGCGLLRSTFTSTSTVVSSPTPSAYSFTGSMGKVDGYYNLGFVTMTSGALSGLMRPVKKSVGNTITLNMPFPSAPAVGTTFSIYPGCDQKLATCTGKFSNQAKFRGFPFIPKNGED